MNKFIFAAVADNTLTSNAPGIDLTFDRVIGILTSFTCWFTQIALLLTVGAIVVYGLQMAISRDNVEMFTKAKKSLGWAIVGAFVIFGVYTIIATVANAVGAQVPALPLSC